MYKFEVESDVDGHPCLLGVTTYIPAVPAYCYGSPDNWEPAEPAQIEYEVLNLRGRYSAYLTKLVDKATDQRLIDEIKAFVKYEY